MLRFDHHTTKQFRHLLSITGILTLLCSSVLPSQGFAQSVDHPYTIVIDAGHGGKDPGCAGKNSKEKEICLNVALKFGQKIKSAHPEVNVQFTRDKDVFIPLKERAAMANKNQADLFISLHCNYVSKKPHVCGSETYVMGLHKVKQNMDVAKRENAVIQMEDHPQEYVDLDSDSPIGHIMLQNLQGANLEHSIRFAGIIQKTITEELKRVNRGVKQAGFIVLYYTTMPAVLVEMGFLSNSEEESYLLSEEGTEELSQALSKAFTKYYDEIELMEHKTPAIEPVASQTLFKIQIAASRNRPLLETNDGPWKSIKDFEVIEEGGLFKYLTGNFRSLEHASVEKEKLRSLGFNGAFIVAYKDDIRISISSE